MSTQETIPDIICDNQSGRSYRKGKYYGKGGFAKCYQVFDMNDGKTYASKIVSKKMINQQFQKDKMMQEIKIHQSLKHKNIVGFHYFFDDPINIYILLDLCKNRSMMELHKRRKMLTEPETRFFMKQIVQGVIYLHNRKIIHRDLKLGNLFLDNELIVKIGDFGLAATIEFDGERKKTLCGTPNYIAPEILTKKGHSFEVDIWSIGCIMYTLLLGRPPFETKTLKDTYAKIKKCDYKITANITIPAKKMIMAMLQPDPQRRPSIHQLEKSEFFYSGYTPPSLPVSCLSMAPRFDQIEMAHRPPLIQINGMQPTVDLSVKSTVVPPFEAKKSFIILRDQLMEILTTSSPQGNFDFTDEMCDPEAQPLIWVSKWVDYSDKYGFGYQLSDDSVGVMFNDTTKLILLANGINVHYIDKAGEEHYMTMMDYPSSYEKKFKLLSYFHKYMREHLMKAGSAAVRENDSLSRIPYLHQWCRSTSGVLLQLNNGSVQVNFTDHTKIILCPLMTAITWMDDKDSFKTFRFSKFKNNTIPLILHDKLKYSFEKITSLLRDTTTFS